MDVIPRAAIFRGNWAVNDNVSRGEMSGKTTFRRKSFSIRCAQRGAHYSLGVSFLLQLVFISADMSSGRHMGVVWWWGEGGGRGGSGKQTYLSTCCFYRFLCVKFSVAYLTKIRPNRVCLRVAVLKVKNEKKKSKKSQGQAE